MSFELQAWTIYFGLAIVGIFTGLGNALGKYLFDEYIHKRALKKLEQNDKIQIP